MVMRSRGGGAGAPNRGGARSGGGVVRPVYEDFKPKSEWQQNDELHILDINLPGFTKEQIKVSTEGRNTIRVRGERLVGGNKWSRFLENFQVPQNGEMNSIHAKFQGGTLTITISKSKTHKKIQDQNLRPTTPKTIDVQKQPTTPIKRQESSDPMAKKEPSHDPTAKREPSHDPTAKKELSHDPTANKESSHDPIMAKKEPSDHAKQERIETKEKQQVASEKNDDLTRKTGEKKRENKEVINNGELKLGNEKYKKGVKGIVHELNEERQLLVNMGVALLVIVALTAHITYKFATPNFK